MATKTTAGYAWELTLSGADKYSVRHRRLNGVWETPSRGGWDGYAGALHALCSTGVSEAAAKEMLALAAPGKLVRFEDLEIKVLNLRD